METTNISETTKDNITPPAPPAPDPAPAPAPIQSDSGEPKLVSLNEMSKMFGEEAVVTETTKVEAKGVEAKPSGAPPVEKEDKVSDRDYEGFSEEERKLLGKMSRESFDWTTKVAKESRKRVEENKTLRDEIKALKEGRESIPDSYYQNPEAYQFSQEYKVGLTNYNTAAAVRQHWEEQALRIEKGEDWYDLVDTNEGPRILDKEPKPASAEAKVNVFRWLSHATNQVELVRGDIERLRYSHVAKHEKLVGTLRGAEEQYFPSFGEKATPENKKLHGDMVDWLKQGGIPTDNPLFNILAKSTALNILLRSLLQQQMNKGESEKTAEADRIKAGPNNGSFAGGSGQKSDTSGGPEILSASKMDALLGEI